MSSTVEIETPVGGLAKGGGLLDVQQDAHTFSYGLFILDRKSVV